MSKKIILTGIIAVLALAFIIVACSDKAKDSPIAPEAAKSLHKTSDGCGVVPEFWNTGPGGNVECSQVGSYEYSSGRINYNEDDGNFYDEEGNLFDFGALGFTVIVTNDTYVSWEFSKEGYYLCGLAVIVKGGPAANVYIYDEEGTCQADYGLASPEVASGKPANLSNLTFCWNECKLEEECEWIGETAWAAGNRYVSRGNWATYTPYVAGSTVTLYAGQNMDAGTVSFSAVVDGKVTITITLNPGWRFYDDPNMENVKIQDYADAPSGNPAPGLFDHKGYATSSPFSMVVPENNFYGVHVDVEWEKCE